MNGDLPLGWRKQTLSGIVTKTISYGIVQAGKHIPDGVPYIKSSDISGSKSPELCLLQRTSKEIHKKYIRSSVHPGDIVFSLRGNIGDCALVPEEILEANLTQGTARISLKSNYLNHFILYQLLSQDVRLAIDKKSKGSTFREIALEELRKIELLVPSFCEQQKIARTLSTWDAAIDCMQKLLENSRQQKKALMQQLLTGRKRLSGFSGKWVQLKIQDLFERVSTKNNGHSKNVVTISAQHGLIRQEEFFNKTVASDILDNYFLLKKGEFAYNKSYSQGYPVGAIKRLNKYEYGVVTSLYICFKAKEEKECDTDFFEQYFEFGCLNKGLEKVANEGGRAHGLLNVRPSDFLGLEIQVPPIEEQTAIAEVLSSSDAVIAQYEAKLANLQAQKKALMQQLLTGKRRVKLDEPADTPAA